MAKKLQAFDLHLAPGNGLSGYQFPPEGHVFGGGRPAARTWTKLLSITKVGTPLPAKKTKRSVLGEHQIAAKKTPSGGNYPTRRCLNGCSGYIKLSIPTGKCSPATVTRSVPCTCVQREIRPPSVERTYPGANEIFGELILHINQTYDDFVVHMAEQTLNGRRNNGTKNVATLFTSKGSIFECETIKENDDTFKFVQFLDISSTTNRTNAIIPTPDADMTICCQLCNTEVVGSYYQLCHEGSSSCNEPLCDGCLKRCYESRQFSPLFTNDRLINAKVFALINNMNPIKCPYCRLHVREYVLHDLVRGPGAELGVPIPYGWVGERACMNKLDYESALAIFTTTIFPYLEIYWQAASKCKLLSLLNANQSTKLSNLAKAVLHKLMRHCIEHAYTSVKWVQNRDLPIPDEHMTEQVNVYDGFEVTQDVVEDILNREF